ncbi:hypothetical protein [Mesohalobacter halotolerans]|uniref:Uncharacterized protein n=1 Tax=Mesohalobacter halotolerans TaxID=1883405 RepID=A0A4U5TSW2_9FLAO|nr:hypothetical protein [Mesohalobacter halotolerans]MBS3738253.1 hypothetical protein [Psychroflexus sp.]TKS57429.1 hypothetical protein FCN74_03140 [Mesohalobacter halotolerans]
MKNILIILVICVLGFSVSKAQNNLEKIDDLGRIAIVPYVANQVENIPLSAKNNLQSKMAQILTANGIAGSTNYNSRFIITPNVSVLSKDVVAGAPPKVALVLEVAFYIGDGVSGTKFGSTAITVKGVGRNENKAYLSAFKNISSSNSQIKNLVDKAKEQILAYYNDGCDFIIKEAESLTKQNKFDEALFSLTSVPFVSKECFNKAQDMAADVYKQKINRDCDILLNMANNAWNSGQNYEAAKKAGFYLNQIEPDSKCYSKVKGIANTIQKGVKKNTDREWNFIENQQKFSAEVEKNRLLISKEIALAYANNQPETIYNIKGWW